MTEIGFIVQPEDRIPADVTWVEDRAGDAHERDDEGQWHQEGIGNDPVPWDDEQLREWGPLTVTAVREQPAEPAEPKRRLRACVENWPEAETGAYDPRCCRFPKSCSADVYDEGAVREEALEPAAEPEPVDVLDLVRQYGVARLEAHRAFQLGAEVLSAEHRSMATEWLARIEAEVNRLRDELDKARTTAGSVTSSLKRAIDERDEARRQRDRARYERDYAVMRLDQAFAAAESDPLVLSLPKVPEGAVALVTRNQDGDEVRFVPAPKRPGSWVMASGAPTGDWLLVEILRTFDGSVSVVMREPRTWPKISSTEDEPEHVDVDGHGRWKRSPGTDVYVHEDESRGFYSFADLRELGDVTEVFDDEDGTR